jgi:hypothetical protein
MPSYDEMTREILYSEADNNNNNNNNLKKPQLNIKKEKTGFVENMLFDRFSQSFLEA